MTEPSKRVEDILLWVTLVPFVALWGCVALGTAIPLTRLIHEWLVHGVVHEYDLYWYMADMSCAATGFIQRGFEGMTLCREEFDLTQLVGLNKILKFIFDIPVFFLTPVVGGLLLWAYMGLVKAFADWYHRTRKY